MSLEKLKRASEAAGYAMATPVEADYAEPDFATVTDVEQATAPNGAVSKGPAQATTATATTVLRAALMPLYAVFGLGGRASA